MSEPRLYSFIEYTTYGSYCGCHHDKTLNVSMLYLTDEEVEEFNNWLRKNGNSYQRSYALNLCVTKEEFIAKFTMKKEVKVD